MLKSSIEDYIYQKKALFIPVYSMRDYETGSYNLQADGNMARIISKLASSNFEGATVLIPGMCIGEDYIKRQLKELQIENVTLQKCNAYRTNAAETRNSINDFMEFIDNELNMKDYDIVISEPNKLTMALVQVPSVMNEIKELVYWLPASITTGKQPWFVEQYGNIDKYIAKRIPTAVLTVGQKNVLEGNSFIDKNFYDPQHFYKATYGNVIFFPFRLTDESYMAKEISEMFCELYHEGYDFKVLYSDPNNSGLFDDLNSNLHLEENRIFVKVPTDKTVYDAILEKQPIIPYMEDTDSVLHISIFEFTFNGCRVIMKTTEDSRFINIPQVNNITELKQQIIRELNER